MRKKSSTEPPSRRGGSETAAVSWHALSSEESVTRVSSDARGGLAASMAAERLSTSGPNVLEAGRRRRWVGVLARQFRDALIWVLLAAAAVSLAIGEITDAITILVIVVVNGVLGFVQEWRAERAIEALRSLMAPRCRVVRDGDLKEIDAADLVVGDLVALEVGDRVPADLRLVESLELRVDESVLTGESGSVSKSVKACDAAASLAERSSMAWLGTVVTNGRGRGMAVATGMATEFGRIAGLTIEAEDQPTPLQLRLVQLGKQLGIIAVMISALVSVVGWLAGYGLAEMFLTGVALAVAVVPEGLPAVLTITLALGVRNLVRRRALVRRLHAAETLGAASVICTDKTGTLTSNQMTLRTVWLPRGRVQISGIGYQPVGRFEVDGETVVPSSRPDLMALLETGRRCNHSRIVREEKEWRQIGEPTEAALLVAAHKAGLEVREEPPPLTEFSFTSARKRMTVVEERAGERLAHVKGAPEVILERCSRLRVGDAEEELESAAREAVREAYEAMAAEGLRVLALARRRLPPEAPLEEAAVERDLTLLGLVGILDPPRPEVPRALEVARRAGIRVFMVTGDAAATALSLASRLGLEVRRVIGGREMSALSDAELGLALEEDLIFARADPEQKVRLVEALQRRGEVVAMTGDGVNDAPALKRADIGIAMGIRGTDVARGAADMILADDNFVSIVAAVEEGRRHYDNIRKFVRYLLSSNSAEIFAIVLSLLIGGPLILLPVQILWMNLVTDGLTAVALGVEPPEERIMERPPRPVRAPIVGRAGLWMVVLLGTYMGVTTFLLYRFFLGPAGAPVADSQVELARTVAFTGLIVLEKANVFNFRSLREPLAERGILSNRWLLAALGGTLALQVSVVYLAPLQKVFHTVALGWREWSLILTVTLPLFIVPEWFKRRRWAAEEDLEPPVEAGVAG